MIDIKRSTVVAALDHIAEHSGPIQANRVLSDISCVMKFYLNRDDEYSPPRLDDLRQEETSRSRVLDDDEIVKVWKDGNAFVKFLLLTGARRGEVAAMQWKEIVGSDWILPAARNMKTEQDLIRPLSKAALALLPPRGADDEFVFGTVPDRPLQHFDRIKRLIHHTSGTTGWTLHDTRRTARTLLSRAGVQADHAERCLGHVIGGIRGIYDRHEFYAEKKHAFVARLYPQLAAGKPGKPKKGNDEEFLEGLASHLRGWQQQTGQKTRPALRAIAAGFYQRLRKDQQRAAVSAEALADRWEKKLRTGGYLKRRIDPPVKIHKSRDGKTAMVTVTKSQGVLAPFLHYLFPQKRD
jgi:hypothetical protein